MIKAEALQNMCVVVSPSGPRSWTKASVALSGKDW